MRRHRFLMNRIAAWAAEQERLAEAEGLRELADTTHAWLLACLAARREGKALPTRPQPRDCGHLDAAVGARARLLQKLREAGERLQQRMALEGEYDVE